jgi:hypothetical protein
LKKYRQKYRQFTLCLYVWRFGYSLSANAFCKVCGIPMIAFGLRSVSLRGEIALAPREILGARPPPYSHPLDPEQGLPSALELCFAQTPPLQTKTLPPGGYIFWEMHFRPEVLISAVWP